MNQPNVTISFNYTVALSDAPALLQKLIATLPPAEVAAGGVGLSARSWPLIPSSVGAAYRKIAEENLALLREGEIPDDGWGAVTKLPEVIASLRPETRRVILRAIENGGHVSRDEVYELLGRDQSKSLKGFTKPVSSAFDRLVAAGELPKGAKPLLSPIYQKTKTYQQAQGFAVPVQVVSMMTQQTTVLS